MSETKNRQHRKAAKDIPSRKISPVFLTGLHIYVPGCRLLTTPDQVRDLSLTKCEHFFEKAFFLPFRPSNHSGNITQIFYSFVYAYSTSLEETVCPVVFFGGGK